MVKTEANGGGEVTSFGALCTAMASHRYRKYRRRSYSHCGRRPGCVFWMILAACFGMATKYSEGVLSIKYRVIKRWTCPGRAVLLYENGMGKSWKWLAKLFAILTWWPDRGSAPLHRWTESLLRLRGFFDPNSQHMVSLIRQNYSISIVSLRQSL